MSHNFNLIIGGTTPLQSSSRSAISNSVKTVSRFATPKDSLKKLIGDDSDDRSSITDNLLKLPKNIKHSECATSEYKNIKRAKASDFL